MNITVALASKNLKPGILWLSLFHRPLDSVMKGALPLCWLSNTSTKICIVVSRFDASSKMMRHKSL